MPPRSRDFSNLVVAHNAEFDVGFYNREMERLGRGPISKPIFCTMGGYRQKILHDGRVPPERISRERIFERHLPPNWGCAVYEASRALEDAWLAMRVYLWLNNCAFSGRLPPEFTGDPINLRSVPPLPIGPLPRRQRKRVAAPPLSTQRPPRTVLQ